MMPWPSGTPGLRSRLFLFLLATILPVTLAGVWLAQSTRRSAEELLRSRLGDASLTATQEIGHRWVDQRSELLDLTEADEVVSALLAQRPIELEAGPEGAVRETWARLSDIADAAVFRDTAQIVRGSLVRSGPRAGAEATRTVPVVLDVYGSGSSSPVGSVELRLALESLVPPGLRWGGATGGMMAFFDSEGAPLAPLPFPDTLLGRERFEWHGTEWMVVRRKMHEPPLEFAIAGPLAPLREPFAEAARRGGFVLAIALLGSFVLATLMARRLARPIENLSAAADAVAAGALDRTVEQEGPLEIRRLAVAFNAMTEGLRNVMKQLRQKEAAAAVGEFAASLAHEVRTPLTSIRLDLERVRIRAAEEPSLASILDDVIADVDRLEATVAATLRVARNADPSVRRVDVLEIVRDALRAAEAEARTRDVLLRLQTSTTGPLTVLGDATALEQLVSNLVANAIEAVEDGGQVVVTVQAGEAVRIEVRDDGHGIPPDAMPHVFEPFFTTRAKGTGLGLPLVRRIARSHQGEVTIATDPDRGTTVTVTLPLGPA